MRPHPAVLVTRTFSDRPGNAAQLEAVLLQWDAAIARKALEDLQHEAGGDADTE